MSIREKLGVGIALGTPFVNICYVQIESFMFGVFASAPEYCLAGVADGNFWQENVEQGIEDDRDTKSYIEQERFVDPHEIQSGQSADYDHPETEIPVEVFLDVKGPLPAGRTGVYSVVVTDPIAEGNSDRRIARQTRRISFVIGRGVKLELRLAVLAVGGDAHARPVDVSCGRGIPKVSHRPRRR